jgi:hypothetical protein
MLSEAKLIRADTESLDAKSRGSVSLSAETRLVDSKNLARRERSIGADADDVIRILEEEGTTLIAPPILRRVKDDLENAAGLLDRAETGATTRAIQIDVETALKELIDALRPPNPRPRSGSQGGQAGRRRSLITPAMEVRMLAAAQRRIRERTERLDQVAPPERAEQAAKVAETEKALGELATKVIEKYPDIDPFILGADNEDEIGPETPEAPEKDRKERGHEDH